MVKLLGMRSRINNKNNSISSKVTKKHFKSGAGGITKRKHNWKTITQYRNVDNLERQQEGGFLGFWGFDAKYKKFMGIVGKFNKLDKELDKEFDSIKAQSATFEGLAKDTAKIETEYIQTHRQLVVMEVFKRDQEELPEERRIKTAEVDQNIITIGNRKAALIKKLDSNKKNIKHEIPQYVKLAKRFLVKRKAFNKINEEYGKMGEFYQDIKNKRDKYSNLKATGGKSLTKGDKSKVRDYEKHKVKYEQVVKIGDEYVDARSKILNEIDSYLQKAENYKIQFGIYKEEGKDAFPEEGELLAAVDKKLEKIGEWEKEYNDFADLVFKVNKKTKTFKENIEKILAALDIIIANTATIFQKEQITKAYDNTFVKKAKREVEFVLEKVIPAIELHFKELKGAFYAQTPAARISLDYTQITGTLNLVFARLEILNKFFGNVEEGQKGGTAAPTSERRATGQGRGSRGRSGRNATRSRRPSSKKPNPKHYNPEDMKNFLTDKNIDIEDDNSASLLKLIRENNLFDEFKDNYKTYGQKAEEEEAAAPEPAPAPGRPTPPGPGGPPALGPAPGTGAGAGAAPGGEPAMGAATATATEQPITLSEEDKIKFLTHLPQDILNKKKFTGLKDITEHIYSNENYAKLKEEIKLVNESIEQFKVNPSPTRAIFDNLKAKINAFHQNKINLLKPEMKAKYEAAVAQQQPPADQKAPDRAKSAKGQAHQQQQQPKIFTMSEIHSKINTINNFIASQDFQGDNEINLGSISSKIAELLEFLGEIKDLDKFDNDPNFADTKKSLGKVVHKLEEAKEKIEKGAGDFTSTDKQKILNDLEIPEQKIIALHNIFEETHDNSKVDELLKKTKDSKDEADINKAKKEILKEDKPKQATKKTPPGDGVDGDRGDGKGDGTKFTLGTEADKTQPTDKRYDAIKHLTTKIDQNLYATQYATVNQQIKEIKKIFDEIFSSGDKGFKDLTQLIQKLANTLFKIKGIEGDIKEIKAKEDKTIAMQIGWITKPNDEEIKSLQKFTTADELAKLSAQYIKDYPVQVKSDTLDATGLREILVKIRGAHDSSAAIKALIDGKYNDKLKNNDNFKAFIELVEKEVVYSDANKQKAELCKIRDALYPAAGTDKFNTELLKRWESLDCKPKNTRGQSRRGRGR